MRANLRLMSPLGLILLDSVHVSICRWGSVQEKIESLGQPYPVGLVVITFNVVSRNAASSCFAPCNVT